MDYQQRQFLLSGTVTLLFWLALEVALAHHADEASVFLSAVYSITEHYSNHL